MIIEVKVHGTWWKVVEAPGVEPIFPSKEEALHYATERMREREGEVRVLNAQGEVENVIPFSASGW